MAASFLDNFLVAGKIRLSSADMMPVSNKAMRELWRMLNSPEYSRDNVMRALWGVLNGKWGLILSLHAEHLPGTKPSEIIRFMLHAGFLTSAPEGGNVRVYNRLTLKIIAWLRRNTMLTLEAAMRARKRTGDDGWQPAKDKRCFCGVRNRVEYCRWQSTHASDIRYHCTDCGRRWLDSEEEYIRRNLI